MNPILVLKESNCWESFKSHLEPLSKKQKGDAFELLTKYYFRLHPTYKTQLTNVWLLKEVPLDIKKYLNLPDSDQGIDLIVETWDKNYWAIQCKYREDENTSLTRKDLSTFFDLAFTICKNIEFGLICTSVNRFSHTLKMYGNKIGYCAGDKWRELDEVFFKQLHISLGNKEATIDPIKPYPHQESAIKSALQYFREEKKTRGKLIFPCGSGKSLVAFWISQALQAQKILIAVPSLALIRQTLEVWARESLAVKKNFKWIAVCSDESVIETGEDNIAEHIQDLGIRVETDEERISTWLTKNKDIPTIVFSTYQSSRRLSNAIRNSNAFFDFGILDEAHKTATHKRGLFSTLLLDENVKIEKRLFMTATERFYRGESEEVSSMDKISEYGDTFMQMSFKAAMDAIPPILSDYKVVTIRVSRDEISELIKKNVLVKPEGKWDKKVEARGLAALIALRKAIKKYQIRHSISYHRSISAAKAFKLSQDNFSELYPEYEPLKTYHVSGQMPSSVRSQNLHEFECSENGLITNAKCLTEGVDIPKIDCVLFADPKSGVIDIVQAVGRALRIEKTKKFGYVVVPIIIDDINSPYLDQEDFKNILTILRALGSNDERIIAYFEYISGSQRDREGERPDGPIDWDIPFDVDPDQFVASLELECWHRVKGLARRPFWEARSFVHNLKLRSVEEWHSYRQGLHQFHKSLSDKDPLPSDIPASPHISYKDKGWIDIYDWIGNLGFMPFEEAREFVHTLSIKSIKHWKDFCKEGITGVTFKPADLPLEPDLFYRWDGWKSWNDWFGLDSKEKTWRPLSEALNFVTLLNLDGHGAWQDYCRGKLPQKIKKPKDIPPNPDEVYKKSGWIGWKDWLNSDRSEYSRYRSFEEARQFAGDLNLPQKKMPGAPTWMKYYRGDFHDMRTVPNDIPEAPERVYAEHGWSGWKNWFSSQKYWDFHTAREYVHTLGLKSNEQYLQFLKGKIKIEGKKSDNLPKYPSVIYRGEYNGIVDWLGKSYEKKENISKYLNFEEARELVRSLGLKNSREWDSYFQLEKPHNLPRSPASYYKNRGWKGIKDWLSYEQTKIKYLPHEEARKFVQNLGLKNSKEWDEYCKSGSKPNNIPRSPSSVYKFDQYKGIADWLGASYEGSNVVWMPFKEARRFARSLNLKNMSKWNDYCGGKFPDKPKKPKNIPVSPKRVYLKEGWISGTDWCFGGWASFEDARKFARNLNLKNTQEWRGYCEGKFPDKPVKPPYIPGDPARFYRDDGWTGMKDWCFGGWASFEDARNFAQSLNLKNMTEWNDYCDGKFPDKPKKPKNIPRNPAKVYRKVWCGLKDWLQHD